MSDELTRPSVEFHPVSGIDELEPDVPYAAAVVPSAGFSFQELWRPVKITWMHGMMLCIEDPTIADRQLTLASDLTLLVLGRWTDPIAPNEQQTWQGMAAQQLGEVLRQQDLAERLSAFGIERKPESYLPCTNTANPVERRLTLNYDELDRLLTAAGFPPASGMYLPRSPEGRSDDR